MAGHVQIGTRTLAAPRRTPPPEPAWTPAPVAPRRSSAADGTLLAVVPDPGHRDVAGDRRVPGARDPGVAGAGAQRPAAHAPAARRTPASRAGLLLDHEQRRVWVDGAEVALTFQEFELLAFLAAHPVTVFSRADLVPRVWQRDFAADSRTVDVHVSRLRHKLGPAYGRCLVTEYRVGYHVTGVSPGLGR